MVDGCYPGNAATIPAVPTISMCPKGGSFQNGILLPNFCRRRTWQLATCQGHCQPSGSVPGGCEPAPCHPTCLPATSCVGFVCQPICSCTACYESSTGQAPRLVSSCQPSCSEPKGGREKCCEASPSQQSSCQGSVFVSRSYQAGCDQSVCRDTRSCQPSCSEVTSCPETSCPPTATCAAITCQPTCCQAGSCHPMSGEGQPCKSTYYQPVCYIFKTCQSVPCMPVPCQPSPCMFGSCNPACCVTSPCQPLPCQAVPFICRPVANCQPLCTVKNSCTSCGTGPSGQPTCGGPTPCNQGGCKSPSHQPACCVTGLGKLSSGDSNCFQPTPPRSCKASPCLPTSCQPGLESSSCKAALG